MKKVYYLIIGFFILIGVVLSSTTCMRKRGIQYFTIVENIELDREWKEISLEGIEFPAKELNGISIALNSPSSANGIRTSDGKVFLPKVMLKDQEGNTCLLKYSGKIGDKLLRFSDWNIETRCFAEPRKYKTLFIKSPVRFRAKKILWAGLDVRDL